MKQACPTCRLVKTIDEECYPVYTIVEARCSRCGTEMKFSISERLPIQQPISTEELNVESDQASPLVAMEEEPIRLEPLVINVSQVSNVAVDRKRSSLFGIIGTMLVVGSVITVLLLINQHSPNNNIPIIDSSSVVNRMESSGGSKQTLSSPKVLLCEGTMIGFPVRMKIQIDSKNRISGYYKNIRYGTQLMLSGSQIGSMLDIKAGDKGETVLFKLFESSNKTLDGYGINEKNKLRIHLDILVK